MSTLQVVGFVVLASTLALSVWAVGTMAQRLYETKRELDHYRHLEVRVDLLSITNDKRLEAQPILRSTIEELDLASKFSSLEQESSGFNDGFSVGFGGPVVTIRLGGRRIL